ncbi:hypothetical protein [Microcoleus vaginatus]|uniref:hypothetical protein n=1 Tax=Microcoleus vaginatus TaxID=119532 RepID=UPI001F616003|nr:hypothetical protein D0A37_26945 [Microcoleus vaginatus HSN003]
MTRYQPHPEPWIETSESHSLLAPDLIRVARSAYGMYLKVHSEQIQRPIGVVVSVGSDRGQLIFASQPILLPGERFVTFDEIESQMY